MHFVAANNPESAVKLLWCYITPEIQNLNITHTEVKEFASK